MEFWFKIIGFGFAPAAGLLTRIFPEITDFVFSWLQPGNRFSAGCNTPSIALARNGFLFKRGRKTRTIGN